MRCLMFICLLLEQGIQAKDIILSGDSCGANLALALALRIRNEQRPQVKWTNSTFTVFGFKLNQ